MTTKERIIDKALTLFSTKGFKGTTVKNIADAVGIKDASLYKHFSSKQEIMDAIVKEAYTHMGRLSEQLGFPSGDAIEETAQCFESINKDQIIALAKAVFRFYLTDSYMSRFWKLSNMEQYNNPEQYEIYRIFIEGGIEYQTKLFKEMIRIGVFKKGDPEIMAYNFYSPIFLLLHKCSGHEYEPESTIELLGKITGDFYDRYHE